MPTPRDPSFETRVRALFAVTPFMQDLGVEVTAVAPGVCESSLVLAPKHLQQNGYVHAGVSAAMADHTAGGAAGTLVAPDEGVLTSEYSIHLLRAGRGKQLRCRAEVLKPGARLSIVEANIFCDEILIAKLTATLAIIRFARDEAGGGGLPY